MNEKNIHDINILLKRFISFILKQYLKSLQVGIHLFNKMVPHFLNFSFIFLSRENIRGVHGSVLVGFVPNPRPTRQNRVEKILTRHRPARESDWRSRFCAGNTVGSVGTVYGEKSSQNSWFQEKKCQIQWRSNRIW